MDYSDRSIKHHRLGRGIVSNVIARIIQPLDVDGIWASIEAWVKSSLGNDKSYNSDDIKSACTGGNITLWVVYLNGLPSGFLTTTINENPRGRTCYAPWLGGENLAEWVATAFDQLKSYLKQQNVISYSWVGRGAWKRLLKADSEQVFYTINLT